jgi:hypothetical protein
LPLILLTSPRSSSLEFYLRHPDNVYTADSKDVTLSGRKFYWHNPKLADDKEFNYQALRSNSPSMSAQLQCTKKENGVEFEFDVYFDGITQTQLQQFYTALTLANKEGKDLCHKIGHSKPLGFGSVKIKAQVQLRSFDGEKYVEIPETMDPFVISNKELRQELFRAFDFNAIDEIDENVNVDYPRTPESKNIYQWFSANRPPGSDAAKPKGYNCKLPLATDPDFSLPMNPKSEPSRQQPSHSAPKSQQSAETNKEVEKRESPFSNLQTLLEENNIKLE